MTSTKTKRTTGNSQANTSRPPGRKVHHCDGEHKVKGKQGRQHDKSWIDH
jgi:hypothetical protein